MKEHVNHPDHYGGKENPYEAIKVIEAWGLGFCLGNAVKYISRAGKKDPSRVIEDLEKTIWYLRRQIQSERREKKDGCASYLLQYGSKRIAHEWNLSPNLSRALLEIDCSLEKESGPKHWGRACDFIQQEINILKGVSPHATR